MFPAIFVFLLLHSPGLRNLHRRTYLYVGQAYTAQGNLRIAADQMYVEHLTPAKVTQPLPILFVHGQGMTGTNWLHTPDGRPGWADYFLSEGYELYIVDQVARGRSPWQSSVDGALTSFDTTTIQAIFFTSAVLHTHQWPGNGTVGDPVFDHLDSQEEEAEKIKNAGSQLLDRIGPVILLTHSQGGQFGWILADSRPEQVKAIIPGVICIQQAKPARRLINLIVKYLREAGVSIEHVSLSELGIHGNGHMLFMEKNNI
ncbi:alpha beta-hydrolase [Mycena olivaceomarginata]|nr:alpha beta-hydrolase [Mycena olivaceomarginata]